MLPSDVASLSAASHLTAFGTTFSFTNAQQRRLADAEGVSDESPPRTMSSTVLDSELVSRSFAVAQDGKRLGVLTLHANGAISRFYHPLFHRWGRDALGNLVIVDVLGDETVLLEHVGRSPNGALSFSGPVLAHPGCREEVGNDKGQCMILSEVP